MRSRIGATVALPLILFALALLSIWPLTASWHPVRPSDHPLIVLAGLAEFAVVVTAVSMSFRVIEGRKASVLLALATFYAAALVPAIAVLVPVTLVIFQFASPILLLALTLSLVGRHLIGRGRLLLGTALVLPPVLLGASVAFYRPAAPGSSTWPVLGGAHLALAVAIVAAASIESRRARRPGDLAAGAFAAERAAPASL